MDRGLRWLLRGIVILFAGLTVWLGFWTLMAAPDLLAHPRNPRLDHYFADIRRGGIYANKGEPLNVTLSDGKGLKRHYLAPLSLSHVVGYDDPRFGRAGLESSFDAALAGFDRTSVDPRVMGTEAPRLTAGSDIITTIDLDLQEKADQLLHHRNGAIVALDPATGNIVAMASRPTFDPARVGETLTGPGSASSPLFHRATQGQYPPGSAFKPVIMAAALEHGLFTPAELFVDKGTVTVGGRTIHNAGHAVYGSLGFDDALSLSSNAVFAQIAASIDGDLLRKTALSLGFGHRPSIPLPAAGGNLPSEDSMKRPVHRAEFGIGQGSLLVTPLQMAVLAATIANGGLQPTPTLVTGMNNSLGDGMSLLKDAPSRTLSSGTAEVIRAAMQRAVAAGTGRGASIAGWDAAGKTGTAENPHGPPHAWFIGFAPGVDPRLAVAVIVEHGGTGGEAAAPIAGALFAHYLGVDEGGMF